jgi:hypothetical protein
MAIFLLRLSIFSFTVFTIALVICVFRFGYTGSLINVLPRAALRLGWGIAEIVLFPRRGYRGRKGG